MIDVLLDTNVFVDWEHQVPAARALIGQVIAGQITAAYSPFTYVELFQFGERTRQEEVAFVALSTYLRQLPLTTGIAIEVGRKLRGLARQQRRRLFVDAVIAITAASTTLPSLAATRGT